MKVRVAKRVQKEYSRVLTDVFELMVGCGLSKSEIKRIANSSLKRVRDSEAVGDKDLSGTLATAALILDAWHRDRRYITPSARPRAVPLLGPAPSVEALIRAEPGHRGAIAMAKRLRSLKLVVSHKGELFKPASSVALLSGFDPLAIQHVARSLSMLIATIRRNLRPSSVGGRLIERIAEVPDLPIHQVDPFRKFTQSQGWALLRTANDWLEQRRAKTGDQGGKVVRAGIHIHAYVGDSGRRR